MDPGCPSWRIHDLPPTNPRIEKTLQSWEGELFTWFADGDIEIEEREMPFGTSVVLGDLRYSWSRADGRSMWGIEARFDTDGQLYQPIRRVGSSTPKDRDVGRLLRIIAGHLPRGDEEWNRPIRCETHPSTIAKRNS